MVSISDRLRMLRGARIIVENCAFITKREKVVIITDTNKIKLAKALASIVSEKKADVVTCVMSPRRWHGESLPIPIGAAMKVADVILAATSFSITHTQARINASNEGVRFVNFFGYSEGLEAEFAKQKKMGDTIAHLLTEANSAKLISAQEAELDIDLQEKKGFATGISMAPGSWSSPPVIEAVISPAENTVEGTVNVDGSIVPGGVVSEIIQVVFKNGKIIDVIGGEDAVKFRKTLESYHHPNVYCAVELGLGLNPCAEIGRSPIEDEGAYGSVHIGLGEGRSFGSTIHATAHVDMVIRSPILELDGKIIINNTKFLL